MVMANEDDFTFESRKEVVSVTAKSILDQLQTPKINPEYSNFETNTQELLETPKPTSPLALKTQKHYEKTNLVEPEELQLKSDSNGISQKLDYNYSKNQYSPMPGSWVIKQESTFQSNSDIKYEDYMNDSTQNSPLSDKTFKMKGEFQTNPTEETVAEQEEDFNSYNPSVSPLRNKGNSNTIKSPIPDTPKTEANAGTFNKIANFGNMLTGAFGISSNKDKEKDKDKAQTSTKDIDTSGEFEGDVSNNTLDTLQTTELNNFANDQRMMYSRHSNSIHLSGDESSVSESNFIDIDKSSEFAPPPPNVLNLKPSIETDDINFGYGDKTPVVSDFTFDQDKTPTQEHQRHGNLLNENAATRTIVSKSASPLMVMPIYEEDEDEYHEQEQERVAEQLNTQTANSLLDSETLRSNKFSSESSMDKHLENNIPQQNILSTEADSDIPPRKPRTENDMLKIQQLKQEPASYNGNQLNMIPNKLERLNLNPSSAVTDTDKHLSTSSSIYSERFSTQPPKSATRSLFGPGIGNSDIIEEEDEENEENTKYQDSQKTNTQTKAHPLSYQVNPSDDNKQVSPVDEIKFFNDENTKPTNPNIILNPLNTASMVSLDARNPHMSTTSSVYPMASSPTDSRFKPMNGNGPLSTNDNHRNQGSQMPSRDSAMTQSKQRISIKPSLYQSTAQQRATLPDSRSNLKSNTYSTNPASKVTVNSSLMHQEMMVNNKENRSLEESEITDNENEDEDDESALFVTSIYPFDSSNLESDGDTSICLSFNSNEIAFTYSLDDSGWGEVTLINTLKRGWVPMNYFRPTLSPSENPSLSERAALAASKAPLRKLFKVSGQFLLNTQSKPVYNADKSLKGFTFDINYINAISDGVKALLNDTGCLSRTNNIIQEKPMIRKMRKKLLRDWYDLVLKAKDYNNTFDVTKIELLQLMTYQVLRKAIAYLEIWGIESDSVSDDYAAKGKEIQSSKSELSSLSIPCLSTPPNVMIRLNEVYTYLITYLALITGRLDLVEHNIQGCQLLEDISSQIMLLIHELQYIGKIAVSTLPPDYKSPKNQIPLQSQMKLVEASNVEMNKLLVELNENVKTLADVANRRNISNNINGATQRSRSFKKSVNKQDNNDLFFYTTEGSGLVYVASKLIGCVSSSVKVIKSFIIVTKDFELPASRKYPNFAAIAITPGVFLKKASSGLASDKEVMRQVKNYKKLQSPQLNTLDSPRPFNNRASKRFSMFRSGNAGDMELSNDGLDFLSGIGPNTGSPFMNSDGAFDEFLDNSSPDLNNTKANNGTFADISNVDPEEEIIRDTGKPNHILGTSFRSLVCLLTDELANPDYFFISTFFLTFRIFSNGNVLLEELVRRFDVNNQILENEKKLGASNTTKFSSLDSKMINRRKLVCRTFQLWMESYWKPKTDYILLAPLINFFNEGVKEFLPIESANLIEIASKLVGRPPTESRKDRLDYQSNIDNDSQLIPRMISPKNHRKHISKHLSRLSFTDLIDEMEMHNSFMDDIETYELDKVDSRNSMSSIVTSRKSVNLSLSLRNSDTAALISPQQIRSIEKLIISYRAMLKDHWIKNVKTGVYTSISTESLIESWWKASQESWNILNQDLALLNFNGLEIAKQLTLIESKIFCSIKVEELLNQNFTSKKLHLNLSPNIQRSVLFTNLLSDYVIESILQPKLSFKQRVHAVKCWLKISISCLYLCNFNSLASIITSLQSFLISRIGKIWEDLPEKYKDLFQYLTSIIHPDKNYHVYRSKLKEFLVSDSQGGLDVPVVPYLSLFLQDLTFVVDGNSNYRTNTKSFLNQKLINIDKYFKITNIIADIQSLQIPYKDIGELGTVYNNDTGDLKRTNTLKRLKEQRGILNVDTGSDLDIFDIAGLPCLQELIMLEIWKVKQINLKEDDRAWKLSCEIQPRDQ